MSTHELRVPISTAFSLEVLFASAREFAGNRTFASDCPHKISLLGNGAGQAAKIALCGRKTFERLRWIVERTEYVELSYLESFPRWLVSHMRFPTDRELEQLESGIEALGGID